MGKIEEYFSEDDINKNHIFCHATSFDEAVVKSIFEKGLYFNETIFSTTCIYSGSKEEVISKVKDHYFKLNGYNIVIKFPKEIINSFAGRIKEIFDAISIQNNEFERTIPNIFIYGCYNPKNGEFILNPNYHKNVTLEDRIMLKENVLKYIKTKSESEFIDYSNFSEKELNKILGIPQNIRDNQNVIEYRTNYVINNFINVYDNLETEYMKFEYEENFEYDKKFIIDSIKNKKVNLNNNTLSEIYMDGKIFDNNEYEWTLSAIIRLSQLLKCAKKLSEIERYNYLGELVSLEPIHTIIGEMVNSKQTFKEFREYNNINENVSKKT